MTVTQRINKLHNLIGSADSALLEKIESVIEDYNNDARKSVMTYAQQQELDERKENHLAEKSVSYSWKDVKLELIEKYGLPS